MSRPLIWISRVLLAAALFVMVYFVARCFTWRDQGLTYVANRGGFVRTDGPPLPLCRQYDIYWSNAEVTDADLGRLSHTDNINILDVSKNQLITDAGLATISTFKSQIEVLDVDETSVTSKGIRLFLARKPSCDVIWAGEGWP